MLRIRSSYNHHRLFSKSLSNIFSWNTSSLLDIAPMNDNFSMVNNTFNGEIILKNRTQDMIWPIVLDFVHFLFLIKNSLNILRSWWMHTFRLSVLRRQSWEQKSISRYPSSRSQSNFYLIIFHLFWHLNRKTIPDFFILKIYSCTNKLYSIILLKA